MSYFIFSMPSAGLMEMPPVSKVTPGGAARFHRLVTQNDQRRRLRASQSDSQQRSHPKLSHAVLVEHLALESLRAGHLTGSIRQRRGRKLIGRFRAQLTRKILGLRYGAAQLRRPIQLVTAAPGRYSEMIDNLDVFFFTLVPVRFVVAEHRAFHRCLHMLGPAKRTFEHDRDIADRP